MNGPGGGLWLFTGLAITGAVSFLLGWSAGRKGSSHAAERPTGPVGQEARSKDGSTEPVISQPESLAPEPEPLATQPEPQASEPEPLEENRALRGEDGGVPELQQPHQAPVLQVERAEPALEPPTLRASDVLRDRLAALARNGRLRVRAKLAPRGKPEQTPAAEPESEAEQPEASARVAIAVAEATTYQAGRPPVHRAVQLRFSVRSLPRRTVPPT